MFIELKRQLYYALLTADAEKLTDNEINIGYLLSKDHDMQDILQKALEKERINHAKT